MIEGVQGGIHSKDRCLAPGTRQNPRVRCRWGRFMQWNLGGQPANLLDLAAKDANILCVQEIARDRQGWDSFETEEFHWIVHRDASQWRGVGVAISLDVFDAVLFKQATRRGIWVVARIRGLGRVILGSLHAHTGVTNAIYQAAAHEFAAGCPKRFRHLPLLCGVDANEVPCWVQGEQNDEWEIGRCSANLNTLVHDTLQLNVRPVPPCAAQLWSPTHFPRDPTRIGRQIDMVFSRMICGTPLTIDPDRRHVIGSDHGAVYLDIMQNGGPRQNLWGNDSKARWVHAELPEVEIVDDQDISHLAAEYTRPRPSLRYQDDDEIRQATMQARREGTPMAWKSVHKKRRAARKKWHLDRLSSILRGDWEQYRQVQSEKNRNRGWWGHLLSSRSSATLRDEIVDHLQEKMCRRDGQDWDDLLQQLIQSVVPEGEFQPFCIEDVRAELHQMKCRSAVGPDKIGVHLLRTMAAHPTLGSGLLNLINHIVRTQQLPASWEKSFLALLAKCTVPSSAKDLRPICVSSAFHKLVSRLVCSRTLPLLRRSSRISCCGKGRQAADLIGAISRIRDTTREWKIPCMICKLDVAGAFDRVDRSKVGELLLQRLHHKGKDAELLYLLNQLRPHWLVGVAPGGEKISPRPDVGIKQGAPESAEVFGLVVDSLLAELVDCRQWNALGKPFADLGIDLLFFQDDIFLIENDLGRLAKKIRVVDKSLRRAGLQLAKNKTKIVANSHYKGCRRAQVGDDVFEISQAGETLKVLGVGFSLSDDQSEQASEMIARTRSAAAAHKDILNAPGSWHDKVKLMNTLVASQFSWTGGALHWSRDDLHALNVLQLHTCRSAFRLHRLREENWVEWNSRSLRLIRVWLHNQHIPRWSEKILTLQHTLHGHWARRVEARDDMVAYSPPMKAVLWRCTHWWREQHAISTGIRHPGRFYASNTERQLAQTHGTLWHVAAQDRLHWSRERIAYVKEWDVRWSAGRQLSIQV